MEVAILWHNDAMSAAKGRNSEIMFHTRITKRGGVLIPTFSRFAYSFRAAGTAA